MKLTRDLIKNAGIKSKTDKILHHGYERFYSDFFSKFDLKKNILEIGYGSGQSINFWKSLFPNSFLYVLDKEFKFNNEEYMVMKCDQSSKQDLEEVSLKLKQKKIGLILDDGSHIPEHQIKTFNILFDQVLDEGGIYIIEDIETSYWRNHECYGYKTNYGISSSKSIIVCFSKLLNWINREFLSMWDIQIVTNQIIKSGFNINSVKMIESISFGHNCICISKMRKEDLKYNEINYRWKKFVSRRYSPFFFIYRITPNPLKKYLRKLYKYIIN